VVGLPFDEIAVAIRAEMGTHEMMERVLSQWSVIVGGDDPEQECYTGERLKLALIRTLFADREKFLRTSGTGRWSPESERKFEQIAANKGNDETAKIKKAHFGIAVRQDLAHRSVFITKAGRLGLVADTVQEGDEVVMLLGGQVPYVLRHSKEPKHYTFVSDCYLHGYMDGECLAQARYW